MGAAVLHCGDATMPDQNTETDDKALGFGTPNQGKPKREIAPDETSAKRPQSDNERLDEGLEETFPASDPVSAKHIT
jgi:hypothetical protein